MTKCQTSGATTVFLWAPDPPACAPVSTVATTVAGAAPAAAPLCPLRARWPPHQGLPQGLLAAPSSHPSQATPAQRSRWCDGVVSPWEVYASRDNVALLQQ